MFHAKVTFIPGAERPIRVGPLVNYSQTLTVTIEGDCDDPKCQQLFDAIYSNDPEKREQIKKELHSGKLTDDVGNSTNVEDHSPKKETHNFSDVGNSANAEDHPPTRDTHNSSVPQNRTIAVNSSDTTPLVKRIFMFLEDGEWDRANEYCETVLDLDPENAHAYLGKLMAELHVNKQAGLRDCAQPFDHLHNYLKAVRFGDDALRNELDECIVWIRARNEDSRLEEIYQKARGIIDYTERYTQDPDGYKAAEELLQSISEYKDSNNLILQCIEGEYQSLCRRMNTAKTEGDYNTLEKLLLSMQGYKDTAVMVNQCRIRRYDSIYEAAQNRMSNGEIEDYQEAIKMFARIPGWKDAANRIEECQRKIDAINEQRLLSLQREASIDELYRKILIGLVVGLAVLFWILVNSI